MPTFIGFSLTLIGAWFVLQALKSRRLARQLHAANAEAGQSSEQAPQKSDADTQAGQEAAAGEAALSEFELFAIAQHRRRQELQRLASGFAPLAALGFFLLALGVAAISMTSSGPGQLSMVDALSIPFFAGALLMKIHYRTLVLAERTAEATPNQAPKNEAVS